MEKKIKNNPKTSFLYNNKFSFLLRSQQPIDNIFIQSILPLLKIQKEINLNFISKRKRKLNQDKIFIDSIFSLNYRSEDDLLINQYLNYLINKGIIIQNKNVSQNYILNNSNININKNIVINKDINSNANQIISSNAGNNFRCFTNNAIEHINNIQILKKKRILFQQIIAQIFIENDKRKNNNNNINFSQKLILEKKENFQIFPKGKKRLQKQLIDSISLNELSVSEIKEEKNNEFHLTYKKKINNIIDKIISMAIIGEKPDINNNKIHSDLNKNKLINYIIKKNEEIYIQKRKLIVAIQNLDNFIISTEIKKQYQKSDINILFIPSKAKPNNNIQKTEEVTIIRNKKRFYFIEGIINLFINAEKNVNKEEENEEKEENEEEEKIEEDDNIIEINNNSEIKNIHLRAKGGKLGNKKKLKNLENIDEIDDNISFVIFKNEDLFIESTYDMLLLEKNWYNLDKENAIKNFFLKGNNNNMAITENINKNSSPEKNARKKEKNKKSKINNGKKINQNIKIQIDKEDSSNNYENENKEKIFDKIKDWNKVNFPIFNNKICILSNKSNLQKNQVKDDENEEIKEIWFNIPGNNNNINYYPINFINNNDFEYPNNGYPIIDKKNKKYFNNNYDNDIEPIVDKSNLLDNNKNKVNISNNYNKYKNNENMNKFSNYNPKVKNNKKIEEFENYNNKKNKKNINIIKEITEKKIINNKNEYNHNEKIINLKSKKANSNDNKNVINSRIIINNNYTQIKNNNNDINKGSGSNIILKNNMNSLYNNNQKFKDENNLNLIIYNYSITNNQNNNSYNNLKNENNKNKNYNEDIVNQGSLLFNNKNNIVNITTSQYLIKNDNPSSKNEQEDQIIKKEDYNYQMNKEEYSKFRTNNKLFQTQNKRYEEDMYDNNEKELFLRKRSKTYNLYSHLLKSKSPEKMQFGINRNYVRKKSHKFFELLREYSFDQNNFN